MSEEKEQNGASVTVLPVAPFQGGAPAVTVRVPEKLVSTISQMHPDVDFATGVTLIVEGCLMAINQGQALQAARADNTRLKQAIAELALERWEEARRYRSLPQ